MVIINFNVDLVNKCERYRLHYNYNNYFCPTLNISLPKLSKYADT